MEITDKKIETLKVKHGKDIFEISVPLDDENKEFATAYFKKPTRDHFSIYAMKVGSNPIEAAEILLNNTFIEGDRKILEEDELFFSAMGKLDEMIKVRVASIKKL
jgi:hypothetical protein